MAENFRSFLHGEFRLFPYTVHKEASPTRIEHRIAPLDGGKTALSLTLSE